MSDKVELLPDAKFVGSDNFKRNKPTGPPPFEIIGFHGVEIYCGDAISTAQRFSTGLGFKIVAKTDYTTGNHEYASYVLKGRGITFVITSPSCATAPRPKDADAPPQPNFNNKEAHEFIKNHGTACRAVQIAVKSTDEAYNYAVKNGAISVMKPVACGGVKIAEMKAYIDGEVVVRFVEVDPKYKGAWLPGYVDISDKTPDVDYKLERIDHVVGNTHSAPPVYSYMARALGLYKFAEFIATDVGTKESGLNSVVVSSLNEMILLPLNEPTFGTKQKSQIQIFLEHNGNNPGIQHIALLTDDIFYTVEQMKKAGEFCGFEFQGEPRKGYYDEHVPKKMGNKITKEQIELCRQHNILIDTEGEGTLLQIFTKPLGDRPTLFIEIIQRLGCEEMDELTKKTFQRAGCGGFGKGNFGALFKSIEDDFVPLAKNN